MLAVRLLWIVLSWGLGGAAVVLLIDAIAERTASRYGSKAEVAALRLRTLRVLGRIVVFFGWVLSLSSELVGKGTLYDWVLSSCWLSAIPVAMVFVGWWREIIFERLVPREKRSAVAAWLIRNKTGYRSFLAATVGGAYLLGLGVARIGRDYFTTRTLVRRVLAYLFRRELTKKAERRALLARMGVDYAQITLHVVPA